MEPKWIDPKPFDDLDNPLLHFDKLTEDNDPTSTLQSLAHELFERLELR